MAKVSKTVIFDVEMKKIYDTIIDYAAYPQFVDGVNEIEVITKSDANAKVRYTLDLKIKKFTYVVALTHTAPNKVDWTFFEGDVFKKNDGGWILKDLGNNKTEVTYWLDIELKLFAPKMILDKLTEKSLPIMLSSFEKRAKARP